MILNHKKGPVLSGPLCFCQNFVRKPSQRRGPFGDPGLFLLSRITKRGKLTLKYHPKHRESLFSSVLDFHFLLLCNWGGGDDGYQRPEN